MSSASVAVIVGANGMSAIGVKAFLLASRVSGFAEALFVAVFDKLKFVGLSEAREAFLEAEAASAKSVAATAKEIRTSASGLRKSSRDMKRFILLPMPNGMRGKNCFMALSLLVTARD